MRPFRWVSFAVAFAAAVVTAAPGCGGSGDAGLTTPSPDASTGVTDGSTDGTDGGGNQGCVPTPCNELKPPVGCGPAGDGCGGVQQCGDCAAPQTCGGGDPEAGHPPVPSQCGGDMGCKPKTCADYPQGTCGPESDGCGGITQSCATCTGAQTCGGDPTKPGVCGTPPGSGCTPKTCADFPNVCGQQADGCGGLTANCNPCTAPETCGGAGVPDTCGAPPIPDAGPVCVPKTCADYAGKCGPQSDGCGGLTQSCNPCTAPDTCGGGGTPGVCGTTCVPKTCTDFPNTCGQQADGCGGLTANCNPCTAPDTCGGGGTAGVCGNPGMNCAPKTCTQACADAGVPAAQCCGQFADGCGGLTQNCGGCVLPDICGGGGIPSECGDSNLDASAPPCTGLCQQIPTCGGGANTTTVTGRVYAGTDPTLGYGAPDPIQHAHVFIPNDPSSLLHSATRSRARATPLPARRSRARTPPSTAMIAMVTGSADPIECVLPKLGIDSTAYSDGGGSGRVQFYQSNGATFTGSTPGAGTLWSAASTLEQYDMTILGCEGAANTKTSTQLANMMAYAKAGGRVLATHYGYEWMYTNTDWGCGVNCTTNGSTVGQWSGDHSDLPDPVTATSTTPRCWRGCGNRSSASSRPTAQPSR